MRCVMTSCSNKKYDMMIAVFVKDRKRQFYNYYFRYIISCVTSCLLLPLFGGVQYVHWVMHKCIMVKAGGKIHVKYVKSC